VVGLVAGQTYGPISKLVGAGAALFYTNVGCEGKARGAGASGFVGAESGLIVAEGADGVRCAEVAAGDPRVALGAGAVLEEAPGIAADADGGRGADLAADDQVRAHGAVGACEGVVRIAARTNGVRGAEHAAGDEHGAEGANPIRDAVVGLTEGAGEGAIAFLALSEVVAAVYASAVSDVHEVDERDAGEADCGDLAGVAAPEGVGAEEAQTSGVGIVVRVVLSRAISTDSVRDARETVGIYDPAIKELIHAENSEIVS
jgi:hypothetical protein